MSPENNSVQTETDLISLDQQDLLSELALYRDHILPVELRRQLTESGLLGVEELRRTLSHASTSSREKSKWRTGIELERSGVDRNTGQPLFESGQRLLEAIQSNTDGRQYGTTTCELASHQFEHNSRPYDMEGAVLSRIEQDIRSYKSEVNRIADTFGAAITAAGILPSIAPAHLTPKHISDSPRYHPLIAAMIDYCSHKDPSFTRRIDARHGLTMVRLYRSENESSHVELISPLGRVLIQNVSMLLESVMTSLQVHIGIADQAEYVGHHRVAEWISPALTALTAASPFLFMRRTGFMESRNGFLWEATTHHKRVGILGNTWIKSPLEQLEIAQALGPLLSLSDANKIKDHTLSAHIRTALENAKTCWPFVRTTVGFAEHGIEFRLEHRVMSAGPTITDEVAQLAFCYGIVVGLYRELREQGVPIDGTPEELDKVMPFDDMRKSFHVACVDALDARIAWLQGEVVDARTLISKRLIPIACKGLLGLGLDPHDCHRYLHVIKERVEFDWAQIKNAPSDWVAEGKLGCTPADLQIFLDHVFRRQGGSYLDDGYRGGAMTKALCEIGLADQRAYESGRSGCGMIGWLKSNFGG